MNDVLNVVAQEMLQNQPQMSKSWEKLERRDQLRILNGAARLGHRTWNDIQLMHTPQLLQTMQSDENNDYIYKPPKHAGCLLQHIKSMEDWLAWWNCLQDTASNQDGASNDANLVFCRSMISTHFQLACCKILNKKIPLRISILLFARRMVPAP